MSFNLRELVENHQEEALQFLGYVAVSGAAFCVDFSIYWALLAVARYAFVAAAGGYVCGVATHYALSSRIVFRHRFDKRGVREEAPAVAKFFAAGASGLLITAVIVGLLADIGGVNPLVAKLVASGCSFFAVFLSLRLFVFNAPQKTAARSI